MTPFTAELIGTMILVLLGDGVVANVVLNKTKGNNGGWIVITTGWACAVAVAVYCVGSVSGGHLNPAVTLGLAVIGKFAWADVGGYIVAQMLGGMLGGVLVWLAYLPHWSETKHPGDKLAVFCTGPAIRHPVGNLATEIIGTFVLVLGALAIPSAANHGFCHRLRTVSGRCDRLFDRAFLGWADRLRD
jgi:glycerol uptake facilitator protein